MRNRRLNLVLLLGLAALAFFAFWYFLVSVDYFSPSQPSVDKNLFRGGWSTKLFQWGERLLFKRERDILIKGVPYIGNFSGTIIATAPQSIAAMITRYWGDERVSFASIKSRYFPTRMPKDIVTVLDLEQFFKEGGYETQVKRIDGIESFRPYLEQDIPLILPLQLPSKKYQLEDHSVLIGLLPSKKMLIFHNNLLGNNYEMSFEDFESSWSGREDRKFFLAVKPSRAIESAIKGPNPNMEYPPRLRIMSSPELMEFRFEIRKTEELAFVQNVRQNWEAIIDNQLFNELRPTGRVYAFTRLAQQYAKEGNTDEAIRIIKDHALPLNHDLEKAYGEWPAFQDLPAGAQWDWPWVQLGDLYLLKNDFGNAKAAYQRAATIDPQNFNTAEKLKSLPNQ